MAEKHRQELFQDPNVDRRDSAGEFANFVGNLKPGQEILLSPASFRRMHIHGNLINELVARGVLTSEGDRLRLNYDPAADLRAKVLGTEELQNTARVMIEGAWELHLSQDTEPTFGKESMKPNSDGEHPLVSHDAELEAWGFHIENFG